MIILPFFQLKPRIKQSLLSAVGLKKKTMTFKLTIKIMEIKNLKKRVFDAELEKIIINSNYILSDRLIPETINILRNTQ